MIIGYLTWRLSSPWPQVTILASVLYWPPVLPVDEEEERLTPELSHLQIPKLSAAGQPSTRPSMD